MPPRRASRTRMRSRSFSRPAAIRRPARRSGLPAPILIAQAFRAEPIDVAIDGPSASSGRSRLALAAAVAAVTALLGGAFWAISDHRSQAGVIAEQVDETKALARTIDALNARLNVIEGARSRDELVELRRSVGEIRSNVASSRELSAALAQPRPAGGEAGPGRERQSRQAQRTRRPANVRSGGRARRPHRQAGKESGRIGCARSGARRVRRRRRKGGLRRRPRPGPNVSMETTGSIDRPRPVLRGYIVLGARDDVALVEGRNGERAVRRGDFLPGAGRVEGIARRRGRLLGRPDRAGADCRRRRTRLNDKIFRKTARRLVSRRCGKNACGRCVSGISLQRRAALLRHGAPELAAEGSPGGRPCSRVESMIVRVSQMTSLMSCAGAR